MAIRLLTVAEVAGILSTTENAVRQMVYRRDIPHVKIGRRLRFDARELERWINQHTIEAAS